MEKDMIDELAYIERQNLNVIVKKAKFEGEILLRIADVNGELEYTIINDSALVSKSLAEQVLRDALGSKFTSLESVMRGLGFE
jgi:3-dehydroquinate dehydratase